MNILQSLTMRKIQFMACSSVTFSRELLLNLISYHSLKPTPIHLTLLTLLWILYLSFLWAFIHSVSSTQNASLLSLPLSFFKTQFKAYFFKNTLPVLFRKSSLFPLLCRCSHLLKQNVKHLSHCAVIIFVFLHQKISGFQAGVSSRTKLFHKLLWKPKK